VTVGHSRLPILGSKGQGWVLVQSVLTFFVVLLGSVGPGWPDRWAGPLLVVGTMLFLAGTVEVGAGILAVGGSFAVLPQPAADVRLRTDGVLGRVRHPIYGGWMLASVGWALVFSPWSLLPAALLVLELDGKRRVEERWLVEAYPQYRAYADRVRRRYLPLP